MTDRLHEDDLARLVREAADQVQPHPALDAIRARTVTPPKESAMSIARTWILGGLGGAVATAAVIGGVWFATTNGDDDSSSPDPAGSPTGTITGSQSPAPSESPDPSESSSPATGAQKLTVPVYWPADTPSGLRLYREFSKVEGTTKLQAAVCEAVLGTPKDRDYKALWSEAGAADCSAERVGDVINVSVVAEPDPSEKARLHDGTDLSAAERAVAVQQLIFTAQAAVGEGRLPVQFLINGDHTDQILGEPASEPLANAPVLKTLSLVNLSTPAEGDVITDDTLEVTGVANSFEANVLIRLQRFEGTAIAFQGNATASGWMGEKLFPFSTSVDLSKVEPGTYTLMAMTDDPSDGEGPGPFTDSKVITIK